MQRRTQEGELLKKNLLTILIALHSTFAFAEVIISKEYSFPPSTFTTLEDSLNKAFGRPEEVQEYPTFFSIDSTNGISLWCPPHRPDAISEGCSINFRMEGPQNLSITIKKNLSLKNTVAEANSRLTSIDPNSTEDHQHFGNLFGDKDLSGSHYFCQPEGDTGSKKWGCYLFVSENL